MYGLAVVVGLALFPGATPGVDPAQLEKNRLLLRRYHEEVWEKGNLAFGRTVMGPGFVSHAQPPVLPASVTQSKVTLGDLRNAFPDFQSHADAILADGDKVIIIWTITGTHEGEFLGIAPTHRKVSVQGMDVLRVEQGHFVEHWGGYNDQIPRFLEQIQKTGTK